MRESYTRARRRVIRITRQVIDLPRGPIEDAAGGREMLQVAFAGTFSARLEPSVRARLHTPCDVIVGDEVAIVPRLAEVDVLVTMAFTRRDGRGRQAAQARAGAGRRARPRSIARRCPAGRRSPTPTATKSGIAEYVIGAMLAPHARLRAGSTRRSAAAPGRASGRWASSRRRRGRSWPARRWASSATAGSARPSGPSCAGLRHGGLRDPPRRGADRAARPCVRRRAGDARRRAAPGRLSGDRRCSLTPATRGLLGERAAARS